MEYLLQIGQTIGLTMSLVGFLLWGLTLYDDTAAENLTTNQAIKRHRAQEHGKWLVVVGLIILAGCVLATKLQGQWLNN